MLRVVTLNLWEDDTHWEARLEAAVAGIGRLEPDVVCLQEVILPHDGPSRARILAEQLGMSLATETGWPRQAHPGTPALTGLAVLTSGPVTDVARLEYRVGDGAAQQIESGGIVAACLGGWAGQLAGAWVGSTHLAWGGGAEAARLMQARQAEAFFAGLVGDTLGAVAPGRGCATAVLAGDFNATVEHDSLRWLCGRAVVDGTSCHWVDAFDAGGGPQDAATSVPSDMWAAHAAAQQRMDAPTGLPARRIDHILVRGWPYGRPGMSERAFISGARLEPTGDGDVMASDHRAVVVDLRN